MHQVSLLLHYISQQSPCGVAAGVVLLFGRRKKGGRGRGRGGRGGRGGGGEGRGGRGILFVILDARHSREDLWGAGSVVKSSEREGGMTAKPGERGRVRVRVRARDRVRARMRVRASRLWSGRTV